ncbi:ScbR family autoregulator-binding transcription factor [Umezawaea sp.]|uniref:ScbR family autoregulator-binding transcription factor n=1 Tax=Umezawaea sp. TaxID=1955258 RepID=UPI002ED47E41
MTDGAVQAADTRGRLLRAAAEVFDRHGFAGARLQAVCAGANVTKGALYCHFPSKEALAVALVERQSLLWRDLADQVLAGRTRPAQALVDLSYAFADRVDHDLTARVGTRLLHEGALFDRTAAGQLMGWVAVVRDVLRRADRAGELRGGLVLRHVAEQVVSGLLGAQLLSQAFSARQDLRVRLGRFWRATLPQLVVPHVLDALRFDHPPAPGPPAPRTSADVAVRSPR